MNKASIPKLLSNGLFLTTFTLALMIGIKFKLSEKLPVNLLVYAIGGLAAGGIVRKVYLRYPGESHSLKRRKLVSHLLLLSGATIGYIMGASGFFPSVVGS